MSLLLELSADTERALEAKAARLGVPIERYAAGVLRRDVEGDGSGGFLAMLADSAPRIAAGTLRPITPGDISQAIADARP
jgi:hypothetical protein